MNNIDELINRLHGEGKSLRQIGATVSLSHITVRDRLLKMETKATVEPIPGGRIETSQKPKLHRELLKIDSLLVGIEKQVGEVESIFTPAGWKVSRGAG